MLYKFVTDQITIHSKWLMSTRFDHNNTHLGFLLIVVELGHFTSQARARVNFESRVKFESTYKLRFCAFYVNLTIFIVQFSFSVLMQVSILYEIAHLTLFTFSPSLVVCCSTNLTRPSRLSRVEWWECDGLFPYAWASFYDKGHGTAIYLWDCGRASVQTSETTYDYGNSVCEKSGNS
jgi:hypothetical protein